MAIDLDIKMTRSRLNAVMVGAAVLVTLGAYRWIVSPQMAQVKACGKFMLVTSNLENKYKVVEASLAVGKKRLAELQKKINESGDYAQLFTPVEAKTFFSDIQSISDQTGCSVQTLNFSGAEWQGKGAGRQDETVVTPRGAALTVTGTYGSIMDLVNRLQDRLRRVWIHSLGIESAMEGSGRLRCNMSIVIHIINDPEGDDVESDSDA